MAANNNAANLNFFERASVVVTGQQGAGKSTLIEKMTTVSGLSGGGAGSKTKTAQAYPIPRENLILRDTPGSNGRPSEVMDNNLWIAAALNAALVSLILFVAEAHERLPNILTPIEQFLMRFHRLSYLVCVCVTKMDKPREWSEDDFRRELEDAYGITKVIFSGQNIPRARVLHDLKQELLAEPVELNINHQNFLKYFDIKGREIGALAYIRNQKARFVTALEKVKLELSNEDYDENQKRDLIFSFQDFMTRQIVRSRDQMKTQFNFSLERATDFGFLAALTNELKTVLYDVRVMAYGMQPDHSLTFRRCPFCGQDWAMVEGEGDFTFCGWKTDDPESPSEYLSFAFSFEDDDDDDNLESFGITRRDTKVINREPATLGVGPIGCGKPLIWSTMEPVPTPEDLQSDVKKVSVEEIEPLEGEVAEHFAVFYRRAISGLSSPGERRRN